MRRHHLAFTTMTLAAVLAVGARAAGDEPAAKHDHDAHSVDYQARGETFLLRRLRTVEDRVAVPVGMRVDDAISASLNYADGLWPSAADGTRRTHIVRRQRIRDEGPDDVAAVYRAELVPLELRTVVDPATGRESALLDLTPFSSWAFSSQSSGGRSGFMPASASAWSARSASSALTRKSRSWSRSGPPRAQIARPPARR